MQDLGLKAGDKTIEPRRFEHPSEAIGFPHRAANNTRARSEETVLSETCIRARINTGELFASIPFSFPPPMKVGILGSGLMGGKLGTLFARAGHEVTFSYARTEQKLKRLARAAGARASAGTPSDAARDADALLLAVHWLRVKDVLRQAGDMSGRVLITCSLPMNAADTKLVIAHTWSGAEELAKLVRRANVVSAFGTVPSEVLFGVFEARRKTNRPSMAYCGDDQAAKDTAATLIRDVGFEPVDAGPLRVARYLEPFTLLMAQLAYEGAGRPELAYRFERFPK